MTASKVALPTRFASKVIGIILVPLQQRISSLQSGQSERR
jgi:hypothetical protein